MSKRGGSLVMDVVCAYRVVKNYILQNNKNDGEFFKKFNRLKFCKYVHLASSFTNITAASVAQQEQYRANGRPAAYLSHNNSERSISSI